MTSFRLWWQPGGGTQQWFGLGEVLGSRLVLGEGELVLISVYWLLPDFRPPPPLP